MEGGMYHGNDSTAARLCPVTADIMPLEGQNQSDYAVRISLRCKENAESLCAFSFLNYK